MNSLSIKENTQAEILISKTFSNEYVANNYGVSTNTIRDHRNRHQDEILENIHFIYESADTKGGKQEIVKWTLRGIIKLGMFIRSPQAKNFRIWAEQELEKSIKELELQASSQKQVVYIEVEKANILALKQREELRAFIHDALIGDTGALIPNAYLYAVYRHYISRLNGTPLTLKSFFSSLKNELSKIGIHAQSGRRRLKGVFLGVDITIPRCTYGIKFNLNRLNFSELIINGEKIPVSDMNYTLPANSYAHGSALVSLSSNSVVNPPLLTANRQEDIIRQNERLLMENRRLKHSLFKAKNKDIK